MGDESQQKTADGRSKLRVIAVALVALPTVGIVALRHLPFIWLEVLWAVVLGPIVVIVTAAYFKAWLFPKKASVILAPHRDMLAWKLLNERWRQSLTTGILVTIVVIALLLWIGGIVLRELSPPFNEWAGRNGETLGLLLIVAVSTGVTFLGAASLGRRLIRMTTGRMPLGATKQPKQ